MNTQVRLSYLRWILRWGVTLRIEHLRGDEHLFTSYNHYNKDDYSEWVNCGRSLGRGCSSSGNEDLIDATKNFLKLLRDNHLVKVEDLYNSVVSISEEERKEKTISVQWDQEQLQAPFVGTIFGNFTPTQAANLEEYRSREMLAYDEQVAQIKQLVVNNAQERKDYWDSDEDIAAPADMTLECNQDLVKPKYASDYLRNGEYPPYDVKFDQKAVEAAIQSKQLDLVKWALKRCDFETLKVWGQTYIRTASGQGLMEILDYLISELKITPDGKALLFVIRSGNRTMVDHLLSLKVPTNRVLEIFEYPEEVTDEIWNLIKHIHSARPVYFSDTILRKVISNKERFEWMLQQGASRKWAIYDAAGEGNLNQVTLFLDFPSINYETSEKRKELILYAFDGMLELGAPFKYGLSSQLEPINDKFKPIYELLMERGLFEKFLMSKIIEKVHTHRISVFEYAETVLGSERWNQLLTRELALELYHQEPVTYFDKLVKIDLMTTFRMIADQKAGIDKIVAYYRDQYGGDWSDKIDSRVRDHVIQYSGNPTYAVSKGFKLYRSIYRNIGCRSAAEIFSVCSDVIEDDEEGWKQQEKNFKEHTFEDSYCKDIEADQNYRVIVFDWGNEKKYEDGYWREQALYDIQNAKMIEKTRYGFKLKGTNNGPLKLASSHEGERTWNEEMKTFVLVNEDGEWRFYTERDGGSLNCGGGYYVRVIKQ